MIVIGKGFTALITFIGFVFSMNSFLFADSRDHFFFHIVSQYKGRYNITVSFPRKYQPKVPPIELNFLILCPHFLWTSIIFLPTDHFVPVLFELIYMVFKF